MLERALRLYPLPTVELDPAALHRDLPIIPPREDRHGPKKTTERRPYVIANMVSSADGRTTLAGKATGIGSAVDRLAMRNLRTGVDAVLVGAGTLRAERLSLGLDETSGGPQPLAVILSGRGDVPLDKNLVDHEGQRVLVISSSAGASGGFARERLGARAETLNIPAAPDGYPDPAEALQALKHDYGVGRLLVEGGPSLNHALISHGLVDELFLTVVPKLLGVDKVRAETIIAGALPAPAALRLVSVHLVADELFLRYALKPPNA